MLYRLKIGHNYEKKESLITVHNFLIGKSVYNLLTRVKAYKVLMSKYGVMPTLGKHKKSLLLLKFLVWNMTPKTCLQPPLYKSMSECFKTSNSVSISVNLPNSKVLMISALSCTRSLVLSLAIPQFSLSRPHSLYDNCRDQADTRWRCKQHMCFQLLCSI